MRKTINILALVFFIWSLLGALDIPSVFLNFLLVGQLPGMAQSLSPSLMLAIMTTLTSIVLFELLARRFDMVREIRFHITRVISRQERLPKRRFSRT